MAVAVYQPRAKRSPLEDVNQGLGAIERVYNLYAGIKGGIDEAAMKDPKSEVSQAARKSYDETTGSKIGESVTAMQLKDFPIAHAAEQRKYAQDKELIGLKGAEERKTAMVKLKQDSAKPTGDQFKVAGFVKRAEQAEQALDGLMQGGFDPTSAGTAAQGMLPSFLEIAKTGPVKQFEQAKRNFISAILRRESGAAISPQEYDSEDKKYFPQAGDTPEVLNQKAAARAQAMAGLKAESGAAFDKVPSVGATMVAQGAKGQKLGSGVIPDAMAAGQKTSFDPEDLQALQWAQANPKDPRAGQIMMRLRQKGLR